MFTFNGQVVCILLRVEIAVEIQICVSIIFGSIHRKSERWHVELEVAAHLHEIIITSLLYYAVSLTSKYFLNHMFSRSRVGFV